MNIIKVTQKLCLECKDRKKYQEKVGESSDDWDSDSGKK